MCGGGLTFCATPMFGNISLWTQDASMSAQEKILSMVQLYGTATVQLYSCTKVVLTVVQLYRIRFLQIVALLA